MAVLFGGETLNEIHPRHGETADKNKKTDEEAEDDLPLEDAGVHEEQLDVHHGAEDEEGELCGHAERGHWGGDEGI